MKVYKDEVVPATTRKMLVRTDCDMCGKQIPDEGLYDRSEVTIESETGAVYPEGGRIEKRSIDMCQECFSGKLVPWLQEQGCELTVEEIDV